MATPTTGSNTGQVTPLPPPGIFCSATAGKIILATDEQAQQWLNGVVRPWGQRRTPAGELDAFLILKLLREADVVDMEIATYPGVMDILNPLVFSATRALELQTEV